LKSPTRPEVVIAAKLWKTGPYIVLESNRKSGTANSFVVSAIFLLPVWASALVVRRLSPLLGDRTSNGSSLCYWTILLSVVPDCLVLFSEL